MVVAKCHTNILPSRRINLKQQKHRCPTSQYKLSYNGPKTQYTYPSISWAK